MPQSKFHGLKPAASTSPLIVTAAVVEHQGTFLVTRRLEGTHLGGHWEFPGGKCEAGETREGCLRRELLEELGVDVEVGERILSTAHHYPERSVELHFYACRLKGQPRPLLGQQIRWVSPSELAALTLPPADAELVERLRERGK